MIIDTMAPDGTEDIQEDDNMVGFVFDLSTMNDQQLTRPPPIPFQPHEEDSVSTLRSNDKTILSTANSQFKPLISATSS